MIIQFSLLDLMIFMVCALGIVAEILLIPILWNIKKVVGSIRSLSEINQGLIKKTVKTLPAFIEDVVQIGSNVRETTDVLNISVPVILQDLEGATSAAKGSIELAGIEIENISSGINETLDTYKKDTFGLMAYIHVFEEVLQIVYRTFPSSK